jgi:hypothetical protein
LRGNCARRIPRRDTGVAWVPEPLFLLSLFTDFEQGNQAIAFLTLRATGCRLRLVLRDFFQRSQFSQSNELDFALRVYQLIFACERNLPIDAGSVMNLELPKAAKLKREPIRIEALNQCLLQGTDYSLNHRLRFFFRGQIQGGLHPVRELSRFLH